MENEQSIRLDERYYQLRREARNGFLLGLRLFASIGIGLIGLVKGSEQALQISEAGPIGVTLGSAYQTIKNNKNITKSYSFNRKN